MGTCMRDTRATLYSDVGYDPTTGCTHCSTGCKNCMAEQAVQRWNHKVYNPGFEPREQPKRLLDPLREKKARRVLVCGLGDLFHPAITTPYIFKVLSVMAQAQRHTFFLLTKRAERMCKILQKGSLWPLPNVNIGVSVENQECFDERVSFLADIPIHPGTYRYAACEPLLGDIWFGKYAPAIGWATCGAERGPHARPASEDWFANLAEQCEAYGIPIYWHRAKTERNLRLHSVGMPTRTPKLTTTLNNAEDPCNWPFPKGDKRN